VRKPIAFAIAFAFLMIAGAAHGQQIDVAFGAGSLVAPSASSNSSGVFFPSLSGGTYLSFSGDALLFHNFGFGAQVAWRASQTSYGGFLPVRPLFYDFNAVWAPRLGKRAAVDLMAGIGAESLRFYTPTGSCGYFGCTNYISSNHFLGHFGGGIRLYPYGNFFIRPGADVYLINNNVEFDANHGARVGVSIGYTFGGR